MKFFSKIVIFFPLFVFSHFINAKVYPGPPFELCTLTGNPAALIISDRRNICRPYFPIRLLLLLHPCYDELKWYRNLIRAVSDIVRVHVTADVAFLLRRRMFPAAVVFFAVI